MGKLGIFLDDERNPGDVSWIDYPENIDWAIVRTVEEFKGLINSMLYEFDSCPLPSYFSFDNDLGDNELEGRHAARFLCDECAKFELPLPTCFIHTKNNQAQDNIKSILESYNKVFNTIDKVDSLTINHMFSNKLPVLGDSIIISYLVAYADPEHIVKKIGIIKRMDGPDVMGNYKIYSSIYPEGILAMYSHRWRLSA